MLNINLDITKIGQTWMLNIVSQHGKTEEIQITESQVLQFAELGVPLINCSKPIRPQEHPSFKFTSPRHRST